LPEKPEDPPDEIAGARCSLVYWGAETYAAYGWTRPICGRSPPTCRRSCWWGAAAREDPTDAPAQARSPDRWPTARAPSAFPSRTRTDCKSRSRSHRNGRAPA
jgi:hypothetical protein